MKAPFLYITTPAHLAALKSAVRGAGIGCDSSSTFQYVWFYHAQGEAVMRSGYQTSKGFDEWMRAHNRPYAPVNSINHFIAAARSYRAFVKASTPAV